MKEIDDGGPAFPESGSRGKAASGEGMSLRDYFAAKAMHAEIVSSCSDATPEAAQALAEACVRDGHTPEQHIALNAYKFADAMIAARQERQK